MGKFFALGIRSYFCNSTRRAEIIKKRMIKLLLFYIEKYNGLENKTLPLRTFARGKNRTDY